MKNSPLNPNQNASINQSKIVHQKVVDRSEKDNQSEKNILISNSHKFTDENVSSKICNLTDQNLYELCKTYGEHALEWRRKFIGLLPEVNKRKLYQKKGFGSIFEFAKKLAGLSEEQVRLALNLEKRFCKMPDLQNLLVNGEVSVNKLARVVSVASVKNQEFLAEQVKNLSQGAVETFVRDEKWARKEDYFGTENSGDGKIKNSLFEPINGDKSLRAQMQVQSFSAKSTNGIANKSLHLSSEVQAKLLELQQKGFDVNRLILELLKKREQEIAQRKKQISQKVLQKEQEKMEKDCKFEEVQKYILQEPSVIRGQARPRISVATKEILKEEYGTKCAVKHCHKQSVQIHHILPFAISKTHNPKFLIPLCREHHELQHGVNWRYQHMRNKLAMQT